MKAVAPISLPQPPAQYSQKDQVDNRAATVRELRRCFKKDEEFYPVRFIMKSSDTSQLYLVTIVGGAMVPTLI